MTVSFLCIITLSSSFSKMLNCSDKSEHPYIFTILHISSFSIVLAVGVTDMTFICLRDLLWVPNLLWVFYFCFVLIMTGYWIFKYFFIYWKDTFSFILLVYWMTVIYLWVKPNLNSQNKFHLFLVYYPFDILLDFVWQYIFEDFCISIPEAYWSIDICSNLCLVLVSD